MLYSESGIFTVLALLHAVVTPVLLRGRGFFHFFAQGGAALPGADAAGADAAGADAAGERAGASPATALNPLTSF
jgi:hypothetical protein